MVIIYVKLMIFVIEFTINFSDFSNDPARIANCDNVIRNIFRYNAPWTYHDVISNMNPGIYNNVSSKPNIVAYCYANAIFISGISGIRMYRMSGCIKRNIWSELYIVMIDNVNSRSKTIYAMIISTASLITDTY